VSAHTQSKAVVASFGCTSSLAFETWRTATVALLPLFFCATTTYALLAYVYLRPCIITTIVVTLVLFFPSITGAFGHKHSLHLVLDLSSQPLYDKDPVCFFNTLAVHQTFFFVCFCSAQCGSFFLLA
jgi:hypothetical protein